MDCQLDKFVCDCCGLFLLMVNLERVKKKLMMVRTLSGFLMNYNL